MTTKTSAPVEKQLWHQELEEVLAKAQGKFAGYYDQWPDIKEVPRLAARLLQLYVDQTATKGDKPLDGFDNRWHQYSDIVSEEDGAKAMQEAVELMLKGHRPQGFDALLGTRSQLSKAERPAESWARLREWPTWFYVDKPANYSSFLDH